MKQTLLSHYTKLALLFAISALTSEARTIYVDQRIGNNEWTGVTAEPKDGDGPLSSPGVAVNRAKPGDVIFVVPDSGPYYGVIRPKQSGEPGKPITVEGNGNEFNLYPEDPQSGWNRLGGGAWLFKQMYREDANPEREAGKVQGFYKGKPLIYFYGPGTPPPLYSVTHHDDGRPVIHLPPEARPPFKDLVMVNHPSSSVVRMQNVSYWHFKNMHIRGAGNDGFNWHGEGKGHVIENCTAMFCGDEGSSAHGNMEVTVKNTIFAFNGSGTGGVVDIAESKTSYINCISAFNRDVGFRMREGGVHLLRDTLAAGNERLSGSEELLEKTTTENFVQYPDEPGVWEKIKAWNPDHPTLPVLEDVVEKLKASGSERTF
ncbi:MAG: right-handed parallel beta-helix repeat-containing protein [Kiritimatiellia bacterium]